MKVVATLGVVAFGASALAVEDSTSFELPVFSVGLIDGQDGWLSYANNGTQPIISDANPFDGAQHLRIGKDSSVQGGDPVGAFSRSYVQTPGSDTAFSAMVNISATGGASYEVIAQSSSEGEQTGRVQFFWDDFNNDGLLGDILVLDTSGYVDTGVDFVPGEYRELRIEASAGGDTLEYFYDDALIYSTSLGLGGTLIEQVVFQSDNFNAGDWGDFDSFKIVPAPGAFALIGLAGAFATRRRRA